MRFLILLTIGLLGGCAAQPVPPVEFKTAQQFEEHANRGLPFGDTSTFDGVRRAFRAYHSLYTEEAMSRRTSEQAASELGFYSSIVGVLGGAFGSAPTAMAGGAGAAGAGLFSDRYRLKVQARSYEGAATAMLCMYNLIPGVDSSALRGLTFIGGANAESDLRDAALESLLAVRARLSSLLSTFELGQPDVSKLKDALAAPKQDLSPDSKSARLRSSTPGGAAPQDPIETYRKDLKVCVAAFTG